MSILPLSSEQESQLRAAIAAHGLESVADLILENTAPCVALHITEPEDYSQVGVSRYGGWPDVPDGFDWPRDERGKYLNFLMQIDLSETAPLNSDLIPARGMLYLFMGEWGGWGDQEVACRYVDAPPSTLHRAPEITDDQLANIDLLTLKPHRLAVRAGIDPPRWTSAAEQEIVERLGAGDAHDRYDAFVEQVQGQRVRTWAGKLLGQPSFIGYVPDEEGVHDPAKGWELFWTLDSVQAVDTLFGDAGYVQIFAEREALRRRDFSRLYAEIESS
jgi:uncharacterized protein YwqG